MSYNIKNALADFKKEDLADGMASGTIESSGEKYHYEVTGKDGNYSVSVKSEK